METTPEGWHVQYVNRNRFLLNPSEKNRKFASMFCGKYETEGEAFIAATYMNSLLAIASNYLGDAP